mmetsp:Transcript_28914/g.83954  ORF Transcript_28914/g.83954 Transcript_28914/m.83954 type:complete len:218 (+) Transcript_28914:4257-4910(+)
MTRWRAPRSPVPSPSLAMRLFRRASCSAIASASAMAASFRYRSRSCASWSLYGARSASDRAFHRAESSVIAAPMEPPSSFLMSASLSVWKNWKAVLALTTVGAMVGAAVLPCSLVSRCLSRGLRSYGRFARCSSKYERDTRNPPTGPVWPCCVRRNCANFTGPSVQPPASIDPVSSVSACLAREGRSRVRVCPRYRCRFGSALRYHSPFRCFFMKNG